MNNRDLTEGPIGKKLVIYFIPILAGTLLQLLYNTVDTVVVSRYVGTEAVAAVGGVSGRLAQLSVNFFVSFTGGAGVVVAQLFGAKDYEKVSRAIHTALAFCLAGGIAIGAVIIGFAPQLLVFLKAPADTLQYSITYLRIYYSGSLFIIIYNMCCSILRALGDSRRPFIYLLISCGLNIILDLVFVVRFHWDVAGVAIATILAQAVSMVLVVIDLTKLDDSYRLRFKKIRIDFKMLRRMMRIGIPSSMQAGMYGVSNLIVQVGNNTLGTVAVAAWALSDKIDGLYWSTTSACGTALLNFVGQNYGAGKTDRIRKSVKVSLGLYSCITVGITALILLLSRPVLGVLSDDPQVVETTMFVIRKFVPFYEFWTIMEVMSGALRGIGDAINPVIIIGVCVCLVRVVWVCTVFRVFHTLTMLCILYPLTWILADIVMGIYYKTGSKMKHLDEYEVKI